jgi:hypothetical protein
MKGKQHTLEQSMSCWKIRKEIPRFKQKWAHNLSEPVGHVKGSLMREVYSPEHWHKRSQMNNLMVQLKLIGKQEQNHPKKERIVCISIKINELETKRMIC